ncbi:MAG: hypothetical protein ACYC0V_04835 [Armatimonadota bacterium]
MKKCNIVTTLILAGLVLIGTMAAAQGQGPGQGPGPGGGGPGAGGPGGGPGGGGFGGGMNMPTFTPAQMAEMRANMMKNMCPARMFPALPQQSIEGMTPMLQLTADQQAKADALFTALRAKIAGIQGKTAYNQSLQDEMKKKSPDLARMKQLAKASLAQEALILDASLETWVQFTQSLTEEQQTSLWNMMGGMGMGGQMGGFGGMRQGGQRQGGQRQGGQRQGGQRQGGQGQFGAGQGNGGNQTPDAPPPAPQGNTNPGY